MSCPVDHAAQRLSPTGCPISGNAAAFDPFSLAYQRDPAGTLAWAREQEPVFFSPQLGYWVVTRYEDVKAVFRDNILFSPSVALEKITPATPEVTQILEQYGYAMKRTMVNEDEPDHMERRRLLMDAFLPERLMAYEPMVRNMARQFMDRFIDKGRAELVGEMLHDIPLYIALKFLGVSDQDADELKPFAVAHTLNTWGRPTPQEQSALAHNVGRFWTTAQRILDQMLANPDGEGWMYETIRQYRQHPKIVPESYLRSMMMAILAAGHETTSKATANAFLTLLTQREAWESLCANPALIPNAIEECLRVAGPIIAWRRITTADATVGGVSIPAGQRLLIVQATANFDPRQFENPDQVDVYRESAVEHLTFGYGAHQCMGKNIGRMQMRVFLEEFTRRLPHMRLVPGQSFDYLPNTSFRGPAQLWVEWDPARNPERTRPCGAGAAGRLLYRPAGQGRHLAHRGAAREAQRGRRPVPAGVRRPGKGGELPAWTAGSHVDLIAGRLAPQVLALWHAAMTARCSASGHPARGPGARRLAPLLRRAVGVGDTIHLSGPKNLFRLDESAQRFVLIAGGIGITPILAMADRLKALGKPYALHYAARSRAHMALLALVQRDHGASLSLHVSEEGSRMQLEALLANMGEGTQVYCCGPERLIDAMQALGEGWPEGTLHVEHFSTPARCWTRTRSTLRGGAEGLGTTVRWRRPDPAAGPAGRGHRRALRLRRGSVRHLRGRTCSTATRTIATRC
jgi:cytochrome P450